MVEGVCHPNTDLGVIPSGIMSFACNPVSAHIQTTIGGHGCHDLGQTNALTCVHARAVFKVFSPAQVSQGT